MPRAIAAEGGLRQRAIDIVAMAVLWTVMALVVFPAGDYPVNDDWVYAASVRKLLESGRFELLACSTASVGPQVYWGALFAKVLGNSYVSLRASTLVLGLVGGIGVYLLFLEIWHDRLGALVLALTLLVNPVYFALAYTFMTDVPFVALSVTSMLFIVLGIQRSNRPLLTLGLGIALMAVLLRQFAVVLLVGFGCWYAARHKRTATTFVIAATPLVAGLLLNWLFDRWMAETGRRSLPAPAAGFFSVFVPQLPYSIRALILNGSSYVGLFVIPLVVYYLPIGAARDLRAKVVVRWSAIVALAVLVGAFYVPRALTVPVGGNVLEWFGVGPLTTGDQLVHGQNLPQQPAGIATAWLIVTGLALVSFASLCVAVWTGAANAYGAWRSGVDPTSREQSALVAFFVGIASSYLAILLLLASAFPLFDRYFLLLFVVCGFAIPFLRVGVKSVSSTAGTRFALAAVPLTCSALFSVVATHDFFAWSDVRWTALQRLLAAGVSPTQIDGGYEFNGMYLYDALFKSRPGKNYWWVHDDLYQVSAGPLPGYRESQRLPVERWWRNGAPDVYILKR